jgi:hypothetical protein
MAGANPARRKGLFTEVGDAVPAGLLATARLPTKSRGAMAPSQQKPQFPPTGNGLSGCAGCRLNTVWGRAVATPTLSVAVLATVLTVEKGFIWPAESVIFPSWISPRSDFAAGVLPGRRPN